MYPMLNQLAAFEFYALKIVSLISHWLILLDCPSGRALRDEIKNLCQFIYPSLYAGERLKFSIKQPLIPVRHRQFPSATNTATVILLMATLILVCLATPCFSSRIWASIR